MFFLSLFGFGLALTSTWAFNYFGLSCFEQIVFHAKVPLEGTNTEFIGDWFRICFVKGLLMTLAVWVAGTLLQCAALLYKLSFAACIVFALVKFGVVEFAINQFRSTDLYEKHYVDGRNVRITFPEKKRNLILLYVESLETTYTSNENGGNYASDLIPEISAAARENLNFSHTEKLGGAHVVAGTGWTTGGLVAQSSGVPLCVPLTCKNFSDKTDFLPGAYTLGDILEKEGYAQEYLIGSDAVFGGRKFYYDKHGHYHIFDLDEAKRQGKIPADYREFWGYEDEKLFAFAKEEITRLACQEQPFNFTMLTVDIHHPYGYKDQHYREEYPERLSNIIRGNSRKIGEFLEWLKQQPFYADTTVIVTGDHLSMAAEYIQGTYERDYRRTVLNAFLQPQAEPVQNKNRIFTSFDMFPTILTALGATVEGDRLGLGVNLFSDKKTLAEELGVKKLDAELRKQSRYFKENIL